MKQENQITARTTVPAFMKEEDIAEHDRDRHRE